MDGHYKRILPSRGKGTLKPNCYILGTNDHEDAAILMTGVKTGGCSFLRRLSFYLSRSHHPPLVFYKRRNLDGESGKDRN